MSETDFFPEIKPIQGKMPKSKEEYWVALALMKLEIEFVYQREIFGGDNTLGGQIIDFWIYTTPLPTPLYVQGKYWHTGNRAEETRLKIAKLISEYFGQINKPQEIWDYEIPTPDIAYQVVKGKLL